MAADDNENHFQLALKFIWNFRTPSRSWKKFLFLSLLLIFPFFLYAKTQTLHYIDSTYKLFLNDEKKVLLLFGPWGDDPVLVDRHVKDAWGLAASFGVLVVYHQEDDLQWAILQRENGEKRTGGTLREVVPEDGEIKFVVLSPLAEKATIKVQFETGRYIVYKVDLFGHKEVVREGKSEQK